MEINQSGEIVIWNIEIYNNTCASTEMFSTSLENFIQFFKIILTLLTLKF